MRRLLFVPALSVAALALTAPAQAQTRGWLDDGRPYTPAAQESFYNSGRVAYDNGFREGLKEGEKDGKKHDRFRYQDEGAYDHGDKGYHREYGSIDRYRQSFRTGFAAGYSDGYQRYSPNYANGSGRYGDGRVVPRRDVGGGYGYPDTRPVYPSNPGTYGAYGGYNNVAFQNGVNDGYEKGQEDARKNRSFDPVRQGGIAGRSSLRQPRRIAPAVQDVYRQFRDGYDRGFRGGVSVS
jgi:hypothetical protein